MAYYNKLIATGRLTNEPQMKYTSKGLAVTNFSLITNATSGVNMYLRVTVWGKLAEVVKDRFHKGDLVAIDGKLKPDPKTGTPRIYQNAEGVTFTRYDVTAHTVDLLTHSNTKAADNEEGVDKWNTTHAPDPGW